MKPAISDLTSKGTRISRNSLSANSLRRILFRLPAPEPGNRHCYTTNSCRAQKVASRLERSANKIGAGHNYPMREKFNLEIVAWWKYFSG
jgi:hypothetical protein